MADTDTQIGGWCPHCQSIHIVELTDAIDGQRIVATARLSLDDTRGQLLDDCPLVGAVVTMTGRD